MPGGSVALEVGHDQAGRVLGEERTVLDLVIGPNDDLIGGDLDPLERPESGRQRSAFGSQHQARGQECAEPVSGFRSLHISS